MYKRTKRQPTLPGVILLEEFLIPLGISQSAFARHIGWTQPKVNEIVTGKRGVTPETAMVFADALNTTPQFWLNLQIAVDLWRAQQKHKSVKKLAGIA
ncbi:MAG: HigA family addiction module antidote protein [Candidatus Melainabacteria bacterium]|jgi:addiction module HigA family antidote|nr:HigA family addiction module antidote protein [Candidatus Melainabacteria bacterium]